MNGRARALMGVSLVWALVLAPGGASAGDGVVEIDQTCATLTGCFQGDAPGYPVTITGAAGRSYRLGSDLVVGRASAAIEVQASDVSIDLNGFEIVSEACLGEIWNAGDCADQGGVSRGITVSDEFTIAGVAVHNGSIVGMRGEGIFLGPRSRVRDVRVRWCGVRGIQVGAGSSVIRSLAAENGLNGIQYTGGAGRVLHVVASGNASFGIVDAEVVEYSVARRNQVGISAGAAAIHGNAASDNEEYGIKALLGCIVSDNAVFGNSGVGIGTGTGTAVQRNTVRGNSVAIEVAALGTNPFTYLDNTITLNPVNGGTDAGGNLCETDSACP